MKLEWRDYIHSDARILAGKPVVKGTRLAVDFILGLFAAGWNDKQILKSYPTLTPEALQAVFAFAAECAREESLYLFPAPVESPEEPAELLFKVLAVEGLSLLQRLTVVERRQVRQRPFPSPVL